MSVLSVYQCGDFVNSCGSDGSNCMCDPGYKCLETETLNTLNAFQSVEFQNSQEGMFISL